MPVDIVAESKEPVGSWPIVTTLQFKRALSPAPAVLIPYAQISCLPYMTGMVAENPRPRTTQTWPTKPACRSSVQTHAETLRVSPVRGIAADL